MKRKLVIVMQGGGIDGLNLLIPQEQDALYNQHRPKLGIAESDQIQLDSSTTLGVHPAAAAIKELYQMGVMRLVQQVAYPDPNQSHFESTDIVIGGGDGNGSDLAGSWLGRFLQARYAGYPAGFPNDNMDSPPGVGFGWAIPKIVWSAPGAELGIKLQGSPNLLFEIGQMVDQAKGADLGLTSAQRKIAYINAIDTQADKFGLALKNAYDAGITTQTYVDGPISKQLRDVAKTIIGGGEAEAYVVSVGSFDLHDKQALSESDNTSGSFATSINDVYEGVLSFQRDLMSAGKADEVLLMTFSEFGRRVTENAGLGTDHGTAWPMLLVGTGVNPGISGDNADLSSLDSNGDFASWNYDYRQVLATILSDWLGAGPNQLAAAGLLGFLGQKVEGLIDTPVPLESRDQDYTGGFTPPVDPDPIEPVEPVDPTPVAIPAPSNLRFINLASDGFGILWDYPQSILGIEAYRVLVNGEVIQDSDDNFAGFYDAISGTEYIVQVASMATDGTLSEWVSMNVTTLPEVVEPDPDPVPVDGEAIAQVAKRLDELDAKIAGHDNLFNKLKQVFSE